MGTGSPGLSKLLSAKPGAGQNIAVHASPTARITTNFLPSQFIQLQFPSPQYKVARVVSVNEAFPCDLMVYSPIDDKRGARC